MLDNKTILYLTGKNGRDEIMFALSKKMEKKHNSKSYFLSYLPRNTRFLLKQGVSEKQIFKIYEMETGKVKKPSTRYLKKCEENYNLRIWDLWETTKPRRRMFWKLNETEVLRRLEYSFRKNEEMFKAIKPDYVIGQEVAICFTIVTHAIAAAKSKPLIFKHARLGPRFTITDDLLENFPLLNKEYNSIKDKKLTSSEEKQADKLIEEFVTKKKGYESYYSLKSFKNKFRIFKYWLEGVIADKRIPSNFIIFKRFFKEKWFDLVSFDKPKPREKYILFFLHLQPEASTLIQAKYYVDQINLIKNLAISLPIDYKVYVKEHFMFYGNRELDYYKKIKNMHNVRVISPHVDRFDLIKNSSLIVTITGTVGLESTYYNKKVLCFGNVFFNIFKNVIQIEDINNLTKYIDDNLDQPADKDDLRKSVLSIYNSSHEGVMGNPHECNLRSLDSDNIESYMTAVEDYLEKIKP